MSATFDIPPDTFSLNAPLPEIFAYEVEPPFPWATGRFVVIITDSGKSCPMHLREAEHICTKLFGSAERLRIMSDEKTASDTCRNPERKVGCVRFYFTRVEEADTESGKDYMYGMVHNPPIGFISHHDLDHALVYFLSDFTLHVTEDDARTWDGVID